MGIIIDGKHVADKITEDLKLKIESMDKKPHLTVIQVGNNPASTIYVGLKKKKSEAIGIKSTVINLPETVSEVDLIDKIEELNIDLDVDAILVQLPLPKHISEENIIKAISPFKDVDGFTVENTGNLLNNIKPNVYPCTPKGVIRLLEEYNIDIAGKHAVIVGRSNIVGRPLAVMLLNRNATVTICHSYTKNLSDITRNADILISAVGKKIIYKDMVKEGAVVVDVGIFKDANGKTTGDVDFENVKDIASYITPVPKGVGPMTIAMLMENTVELAKQ
jgi:methylenetetrahydrofolate dehydrogenase (NADP+)/methenyltetrahydrofolate cyclohydrolase